MAGIAIVAALQLPQQESANVLDNTKLTTRQQREREYYEEYLRRHSAREEAFIPFSCEKAKPWNSYWSVYDFVLQQLERGSRRLLDFGCGNGSSSIRFADMGYSVCAFDISPASIDAARIRAHGHAFGNRVVFSVQTAEHLDYQDNSFDIVVGFDILHHVDITPAAIECCRVLKHNGVAVFREPMEVPFMERIRNLSIIRAMVPNAKSFDMHITEDERKLSAADVNQLRAVFPDVSLRRFRLFSRMNRILKTGSRYRSYLERLDSVLLSHASFLGSAGGEAIIFLRK